MAEADAWVMIPKLDKDKTGCVLEMRPLVLCKDCKYGQRCTDREATYQCFKWNSNEFGALHEQFWFCADGADGEIAKEAEE